ncbi:uncharacterized protein BHQ10_002080 [Talaromyces amestolkiae]|uniref:Chromatin modification-related protein EAF7 n=1 Tax=Talaromyces amestolkiae TaxID=1196081 RepID=A0A364KR96_TALAM|nr:uncharacterized protein BHQ10_002080 [Talaromyces amestolkiae]RAO66068.1 hypothetical protein BHQ10_002080 [Talaromyces amestolkiae]
MPPRKRPKLSPRASSSTPQVETTKQPSSAHSTTDSAQKSDTEYDLVNDPWTDEQETALLKSIVRWKPVGMHKHFRMLAIAEYMKSQGYAPAEEEHTRIPGIWKKLGSLYNLPALDEREDSIISQDADDSEESEYCPFELPEDEYGEMMFAKRLAAERSESPETSVHPESRRGSTVADTDEPRSSPAPSRGRRGKPTRASTRGTRSTRLQVEIERPSSASVGTEDEQMEDADVDDDGEDEGESDAGDGDDNDAEEGDVETASSPATRSTRTQTAKSKKEKKGATATSTTTRRTGRRR